MELFEVLLPATALEAVQGSVAMPAEDLPVL